MARATVLLRIDEPWIRLEPVRLGEVPAGLGTPDRSVVVESEEGRPLLRVDIYRSTAEDWFREEALVWHDSLAIGFGHALYLVRLQSEETLRFDLGAYFGHLCPQEDCLLVASAERLFRVESDGTLTWTSESLGMDGVIVDRVANGLIEGKGEWDPPGGWRPFRVQLADGTSCP